MVSWPSKNDEDFIFEKVVGARIGGASFHHGFALGVLSGEVASQPPKFGFARFILNIEDEWDVAALKEGVCGGSDACREHAQRVLVDEASKNAQISLCVSSSNVHDGRWASILGTIDREEDTLSDG
jgi:hypothetical protein